MITNKDIRVENGFLIINGDKYPLDGQSPETIMEIVEDNSDTTPTENSTAPVTSGGVYTALGTKQDELTFDSAPTDESTNPVTSGGVYTALAGKQDTLTSDTLASGNYQATSDAFEYTGVSYTCPEGKTAIIYATTSYANSKPVGLALSGRSSSLNVLGESTNVGAYVIRTPAVMLAGGETAYLWDKRDTAAIGINPFAIKGIVIG